MTCTSSSSALTSTCAIGSLAVAAVEPAAVFTSVTFDAAATTEASPAALPTGVDAGEAGAADAEAGGVVEAGVVLDGASIDFVSGGVGFASTDTGSFTSGAGPDGSSLWAGFFLCRLRIAVEVENLGLMPTSPNQNQPRVPLHSTHAYFGFRFNFRKPETSADGREAQTRKRRR
jgi:hypothetical protein